MKQAKIIIAIFIVMTLGIAASGCNGIIGEKQTQKFAETEGGYALTKFEGGSKLSAYTVPDEYEGKPVVKLDKFCLSNAEYLETLTIGKNISFIDSWAITNNKKLKAIQVDVDNPYFCSIDGVLFNKDKTILLVYPNFSNGVTVNNIGEYKTFGSYTVPEGIAKINDRAFYKVYGLGTLTLPSTLKEIGEAAFLRCENLQNVRLPNGLETIAKDAFSFCYKFDKMYIPASVTSIGDYAFFCANIAVFQMGRASSEGMTLSNTWLPQHQKPNSVLQEKAKVQWGVQEDQSNG